MNEGKINDMTQAIAKALKIVGKDGICKSPESAEDVGLIKKALVAYWKDQLVVRKSLKKK